MRENMKNSLKGREKRGLRDRREGTQLAHTRGRLLIQHVCDISPFGVEPAVIQVESRPPGSTRGKVY